MSRRTRRSCSSGARPLQHRGHRVGHDRRMTMTTRRAHLATIGLPDIGMPETIPELPAALYPRRLAALRERATACGYDRLVVYADRDHSATLSWLSGFDPRFEEAVLIVGPEGDPLVLTGNECYGMAGAAPLPMRRA